MALGMSDGSTMVTSRHVDNSSMPSVFASFLSVRESGAMGICQPCKRRRTLTPADNDPCASAESNESLQSGLMEVSVGAGNWMLFGAKLLVACDSAQYLRYIRC